jgi:hypothetical protein
MAVWLGAACRGDLSSEGLAKAGDPEGILEFLPASAKPATPSAICRRFLALRMAAPAGVNTVGRCVVEGGHEI